MVDAKIGDRVVCKIREATLVSADDSKYDEKRIFEIIGVNFQGWYIYVPPFITLKNTSAITKRSCKELNIHSKFIGWDMIFITGVFIVEVSDRAKGMICDRCNEYFEFGEPNQEDGTMVCWVCSRYPHYKGRL